MSKGKPIVESRVATGFGQRDDVYTERCRLSQASLDPVAAGNLKQQPKLLSAIFQVYIPFLVKLTPVHTVVRNILGSVQDG